MTARTAARAVGLLATAIVVAACSGGSGATNAPATQAAATTAATQAPAGSSQGNPTFALPSFHGDVDLEKLIPTTIGGEAMTTLSMGGEEFVGSGSDAELTAVLTALGKQPSDLSVAFGGNTQVQIVAFQVNGVPGSQILNAFYTASQASAGSTISDASFGGKSVKKIQPTDLTEDPSYVYTKEDVVFTVGGTEITDALLNEAFSKLP
jgi:hypothetical protein